MDAGGVELGEFRPLRVTANVRCGADAGAYGVELLAKGGRLEWSWGCPDGARGRFSRDAVAAGVETWRRAP